VSVIRNVTSPAGYLLVDLAVTFHELGHDAFVVVP
jgi:hypothetical protein